MIEMRVPYFGEEARLKQLWKLAFGDGDDLIDRFFEICYQPDNMLVLVENGIIEAMTALLPMALAGGAGACAYYVYALATDPAARKKGFGRMLLRHADEYLRGRGADCLTVVPATPSLHSFFSSVDFEEGFTAYETELAGGDIPGDCGGASAVPVGPEEYNRLRRARLTGARYVVYSDTLIAFQRELSRLASAELYQIETEGGMGCAAAEYTGGDTVLLKELIVPQAQRSAALAALARILPASRYLIRTPAHQGGAGLKELLPFGMVKWYSMEKKIAWGGEPGAYMGLGFD